MKTKFTSEMFKKSGVWLFLEDAEGRTSFLGRFKHRGPITMTKFKKELMKNHYVEDYLHKLNVEKRAPLDILREANPQWYDKIKREWFALA